MKVMFMLLCCKFGITSWWLHIFPCYRIAGRQCIIVPSQPNTGVVILNLSIYSKKGRNFLEACNCKEFALFYTMASIALFCYKRGLAFWHLYPLNPLYNRVLYSSFSKYIAIVKVRGLAIFRGKKVEGQQSMIKCYKGCQSA